MRTRITTPAQRDAARQSRADRERAAGIPDRPAYPVRSGELDMRQFGGPWWRWQSRPGAVRCVVFDGETGAIVLRAAPKTILRTAAEQMPRPLGWRNL